MRVLFLTPSLPLPADQGAKLRSSALIRAAAQHHQVDLLAFAPADGHASAPPELRTLCQRVETVPAPPPRSLLRRAWNLVFGAHPDLALRLESRAYALKLQDLLASNRYDVVQIEGLEMMPYLLIVRAQAPRAAVIYDAHNAEMSLQRSIMQVELRRPLRWPAGLYSLLQWSKLGAYERIMMNEADLVLCVSPEDAAKLKGRRVDPRLVPNGVDLSAAPRRLPSTQPASAALFVGGLDYRPNADAVRWLVGAIWPRVRAARPDAVLRLVGRGTERVGGDGVEGLGYVEDFAGELQRADLLAAPLRMGGGSRFKVLEAMAAGVPVVSTPQGLAGIAAEPGRHALMGRTAAEVAQAIVRVLDDRALAQELARAARALVEARYAWSKIAPGYLRLLTEARHRARRGQRPAP